MTSQKHSMFRAACFRPGFTLIELMIVLAIIGIIVSLAASATMQVITRQKAANTELTIQKVNDALKTHWRAVIEQARTEQIPDNNNIYSSLIAMAGGPSDPDSVRRARVIWIKLRLKQQFPMNFKEALTPNPLLVPAPVFVQALQGKPSFSEPQIYESSVCLLLALSQGRKGAAAFDQDRLASTEMADAGTFNSVMTGLKAIIDGWGRPLVFYRWPIRGEVGASDPNPTHNGKLDPNRPLPLLGDPSDPDAVLMATAWNNNALYAGKQGVWTFEKLFHPVHVGSGIAYKPVSYYTLPVIASAGTSIGGLGTVYDLMGLPPPPPESPPLAVPPLPTALRHDPMELVNNVKPDSQDNIYSFRMRLGARGD
jgi:prepilin-type N-terminal cleavage/methylation domain-containing protein